MTETATEKKSLLARLRRRESVDHLVRAGEAYTERYGNHYAAAVTYFSVLSLFPLIMIAFAIAGFVLAGNDSLLTQLKDGITKSAPGDLGNTLRTVVDEAIKERGAIGVLGLLAAAYAGLGWMGNLRDALTAQWGHEKRKLPFLKTLGSDALSLIGLGLALGVSFGLTVVGSGLGRLLLRLVGLADEGWAVFLLRVATIVLSLAANWLVFLWVISRLPRERACERANKHRAAASGVTEPARGRRSRVSARSAVRGALAAAVGFEILKQVATIYLESVMGSPSGQIFGPIIGLLVFANLVSRYLLFITAWTATARENLVPDTVEPPPPAVIRPVIQVRRAPRPRDAAGLLGAGALLGLALRRARRRS